MHREVHDPAGVHVDTVRIFVMKKRVSDNASNKRKPAFRT